MEKLKFKVQGSAVDPYEQVFYIENNSISEFHCSCPAGDRGNILCKHIIAILSGDTSNLCSKNFNEVEKIQSLLNIPELNEIYPRFKNMLIGEKFYIQLRDTYDYIDGYLINDLEKIEAILDEAIIIKIRIENIFSEDTFEYEEKYYFDFYDENINYLFSTKINLLDEFNRLLKKKKIKWNHRIYKNQSFCTTSSKVKEILDKYSIEKKELANYRKKIKELILNNIYY